MEKYEFEEINDKNLPRGFNHELEKRILEGNLTKSKKYRVMKSIKPDDTYGKGELISIIIENEGYISHTAHSYYKDCPLKEDTKITETIMREISDQFSIWKKYHKYLQ